MFNLLAVLVFKEQPLSFEFLPHICVKDHQLVAEPIFFLSQFAVVVLESIDFIRVVNFIFFQLVSEIGVVGVKLFPSRVLLVLLHLVVKGRADRVDLRMELFTELVLSMPEGLWSLAGGG